MSDESFEEQHHPDCPQSGFHVEGYCCSRCNPDQPAPWEDPCICTRLYSAAKREREGILGRVKDLRVENPIRDTLYRRDVINAIEVPF